MNEQNLIKTYQDKFGTNPEYIIKVPGRVNLIGEHTDYNGGFVMPFAINKYIYMLAGKSSGSSSLYSCAFQDLHQFNPDNLPAPQPGHWSNYLIGVMSEFEKKGSIIPPLNVVFDGDIPQGGGLSSSAALENCMALLLNTLCHTKYDRTELAKISQQAEHIYAGAMVGLMDQFITLMGQTNKGILLDCLSLKYEMIPMQIDGFKFVLCNSNVKHSLASSEYNTRRQECEKAQLRLASKFPEIKTLRHCSRYHLQASKSELTQKEYNRALHQVEENQRVMDAKKALLKGDIQKLGELMYASHLSLSHLFEVSCLELDTLVDIAKRHPAVAGARMTGGGFGGNTINLVREGEVEKFCQDIQKEYHKMLNINTQTIICEICSGGEITSL